MGCYRGLDQGDTVKAVYWSSNNVFIKKLFVSNFEAWAKICRPQQIVGLRSKLSLNGVIYKLTEFILRLGKFCYYPSRHIR